MFEFTAEDMAVVFGNAFPGGLHYENRQSDPLVAVVDTIEWENDDIPVGAVGALHVKLQEIANGL